MVHFFDNKSDNGSIYTVSIEPERQEKYLTADFYIWIPDGLNAPLKGILMKQHGCGDNGVNHIFDYQFQAFAKRWNIALMSSHLTRNKNSPTADCSDWYQPANGTGRAFFQALQIFAESSERPEIARLPIAFYGHSGGGGWSTLMNQYYPDRTIAYIHIKGVSIEKAGTVRGQAAANPGLLIIGEDDLDERNRAILDYFHTNRLTGALLTKVVARNSKHEVGNARHFIISYLNEVFSQRLPENPGGTLRPMNAQASWMGNNDTLEIMPDTQDASIPNSASWLPDELVAKQWKQFSENEQLPGTTGGMIDMAAPTYPTDLIWKETGKPGYTITWKADVSWQAGLKKFNIYRNHTLIGYVKGQTLLHGDYPNDETRRVAFEFHDSNVVENALYEYQVTQVDYADRESDLSDPLTV
jgi:hypothetical protein